MLAAHTVCSITKLKNKNERSKMRQYMCLYSHVQTRNQTTKQKRYWDFFNLFWHNSISKQVLKSLTRHQLINEWMKWIWINLSNEQWQQYQIFGTDHTTKWNYYFLGFADTTPQKPKNKKMETLHESYFLMLCYQFEKLLYSLLVYIFWIS